ncbi:MAG TPA: preprotein translocase subunit YajC [Phycisphaerales bacterium]|nr:preprotein translocase subunit YajC [Phycisphaerales bacterium]
MTSDQGSTVQMVLVGAAPPVHGVGGGSAGGEAATPIPVTGAPGGSQQQPAPPSSNFIFMMLPLLAVFILFSLMAGRKDKKKRAEMISSIARHDRVQTIGGVIGTVVDVRDDEVVLKVDESTGTRITFAKSSVQGVVKKSKSESKGEESSGAAA